MVLVIDNYDSFTWNLIALLRLYASAVTVIRNDEVDIAEINAIKPKGILISPGPGRPSESKLSQEAILQYQDKTPILGICLGHQLLAELSGAKIIPSKTPTHGKTSFISHDQKGVFSGIPSPLSVMRYHSLHIEPESLSKDWEVTAQTQEGIIMGIRHKEKPLAGLQFHPESILTDSGAKMIENWLKLIL